jgi:hypothetical protein
LSPTPVFRSFRDTTQRSSEAQEEKDLYKLQNHEILKFSKYMKELLNIINEVIIANIFYFILLYRVKT